MANAIATYPALPGARSPVIFFAVVEYVTPPKLVIPTAFLTSEFRPNYMISLKHQRPGCEAPIS